MFEKYLEGDPIVCEGEGIGHMLHLRILGKDGPNFESIDVVALCQEKVIWDTKIQVSLWQQDTQARNSCALCLILSEKIGLC